MILQVRGSRGCVLRKVMLIVTKGFPIRLPQNWQKKTPENWCLEDFLQFSFWGKLGAKSLSLSSGSFPQNNKETPLTFIRTNFF